VSVLVRQFLRELIERVALAVAEGRPRKEHAHAKKLKAGRLGKCTQDGAFAHPYLCLVKRHHAQCLDFTKRYSYFMHAMISGM